MKWKQHPYLPIRVSDNGYVCRLSGELVHPWKLAPAYRYSIFKVGNRRVFLHVAVCETFNGLAPFEGALCRHDDDGADNNNASNLLWGTVSDNAVDRVRNKGASHHLVGDNNPHIKLKSSDVAVIRKLLQTATSLREIGRRFGVTHKTITALRDGKTHQHE